MPGKQTAQCVQAIGAIAEDVQIPTLSHLRDHPIDLFDPVDPGKLACGLSEKLHREALVS
jgi:hypothetical protein